MTRAGSLFLAALALTPSCRVPSVDSSKEQGLDGVAPSCTECNQLSVSSFHVSEESEHSRRGAALKLAHLPTPIWTDNDAICRALEFNLSDVRTLVLASKLGTISCSFDGDGSNFKAVQARISLEGYKDRVFQGEAKLRHDPTGAEGSVSNLALSFDLGVLGSLTGELRLVNAAAKQNLSGHLELVPSLIARGFGVPQFDTNGFVPFDIERGRSGQHFSDGTGFKWWVGSIIRDCSPDEFGGELERYNQTLKALSQFSDGTIFLSTIDKEQKVDIQSPEAAELLRQYYREIADGMIDFPIVRYRWQGPPLGELSTIGNQSLIADISIKILAVDKETVYLQSDFNPNSQTKLVFGIPPWHPIDEALGLYAMARGQLMHRIVKAGRD